MNVWRENYKKCVFLQNAFNALLNCFDVHFGYAGWLPFFTSENIGL